MHTDKASLHYSIWIDHASSLFYAAYENYRLFNQAPDESSGAVIDRQLSLFYSTCLLFGITIELIFKARVLFEKQEAIRSGEITRLEDLIKEWPRGHEIEKLIDQYNIEITVEERKTIRTMQPFMNWAGRFPFPRREDEIEMFEKGKIGLELPELIEKKVENIINKQRRIMDFPTISSKAWK